LDISWNPGWDELVRLKEIELGQRLKGNNEKMAPPRGQLQKQTIMLLLKKIAGNSDKMAEAILGT
jgi:hypothetical protein